MADIQARREQKRQESLETIRKQIESGQLKVRQLTKIEMAEGKARRLTHPKKFPRPK